MRVEHVTICPHYTNYELKNYKSMLIDCIWYKQSRHYDYDCEFCIEYASNRSKQIESQLTKTRNK